MPDMKRLLLVVMVGLLGVFAVPWVADAQVLVPSSGFWTSPSGFSTRYGQVVSLTCGEVSRCDDTTTCRTTMIVGMPPGLTTGQTEAVLTGFDVRTAGGSVERLATLGAGVERTSYDPITGDVTVDIWAQYTDGDPATGLTYEADVSFFVVAGGPGAMYGGGPTTPSCFSGTSSCTGVAAGSPAGGGVAATGQLQSFCVESAASVRPFEVSLETTTDPVTGAVTLDATLDGAPVAPVSATATVLSGFVVVPQTALFQSAAFVSGITDLPEAPQPASAPWVTLEGFDLQYATTDRDTWRYTSGWVAPALAGGIFDINYGAFLADDPGNSASNIDPYHFAITGRLYHP